MITFELIEHHNIDGTIEFSRVGWRKSGPDMTDFTSEDAITFAQALERTAWAYSAGRAEHEIGGTDL